jgi:hypothetical protein
LKNFSKKFATASEMLIISLKPYLEAGGKESKRRGDLH